MATQLAPGMLTELVTFTTTGTSQVFIPTSRIREHTFYCKGAPGTSAGVISIETAPTEDYAGTWLQLNTLSPFNNLMFHRRFSNLALTFVRLRVTTPIADGSGTVYYIGGDWLL